MTRGPICQVISTFRPLVGGAQLATERLCRRLRDRGADVVVLTRHYGRLPRSEVLDGVCIRRLGLPFGGKLGAAAFVIHALWHLAIHMRRTRIVHVQSLDAPLLVGLGARALLKRRLVVTVHGEAKIQERARTAAGRIRLRLLRRLADGHTALTPWVRNELIAHGIAESRIHTIPNGIDLDRFRPPDRQRRHDARRCLDLPTEAGLVLCLGRLIPSKRVDVLLRAWRSLPPAARPRHLLILGDGPERSALECLAQELALDDVRFEGTTDDVRPYLDAADVYVSASASEGMSLALLEAMAAGLAVVATRIPANEFLVRHENSGILVPPNDVRALARALTRLLTAPTLAHRLGAQARAIAERTFSLERSAALHEQLYRTLDPAIPHDGSRPPVRPSKGPALSGRTTGNRQPEGPNAIDHSTGRTPAWTAPEPGDRLHQDPPSGPAPRR